MKKIHRRKYTIILCNLIALAFSLIHCSNLKSTVKELEPNYVNFIDKSIFVISTKNGKTVAKIIFTSESTEPENKLFRFSLSKEEISHDDNRDEGIKIIAGSDFGYSGEWLPKWFSGEGNKKTFGFEILKINEKKDILARVSFYNSLNECQKDYPDVKIADYFVKNLSPLPLLIINFNNNGIYDKIIYLYSFDSSSASKIQEVVKMANEIDSNSISNMMMAGIDRNNIYDLNYAQCENNDIKYCKSIYDFDLAYFNNIEFPNIYNNTKFEGDEFAFKKCEQQFASIRNKRYLFITYSQYSGSCPSKKGSTENIVEISKYDFNRKGFSIKYIMRNLGYLGSAVVYDEYISDSIFIKMNENDAESFKKLKMKYYFLVKVISTQINDLVIYNCSKLGIIDQGYYNGTSIDMKGFCRKSNQKQKNINFQIVKYRIEIPSNNKIYSNI